MGEASVALTLAVIAALVVVGLGVLGVQAGAAWWRLRQARTVIYVLDASERNPIVRLWIDGRRRKPTMTVTLKDGRVYTVTASRQLADGAWIYRQVGVDGRA